MKIGILTFHCSYNPGAVLQCLALQNFISSLGYQVEIIDYRPRYRVTKLRFQKWRIRASLLGGLHYTFIEYPFLRKYYSKYQKFEDIYYRKSKSIHTESQLKSFVRQYDIIILGSDQIWQSAYNGKEAIWYGEGLFNDSKPKIIAYAASAGKSNFDKKEYNLLKNNLPKFSAVSVRETSLKETLEKITDCKVDVVLDPVLMVPQTMWKAYYKKFRYDKYILVYQGRKSDYIYTFADRIKKSIGSDCKIIAVDQYDNSYKKGIEHIAASPTEFISLIHDAQCVITTSFHGTVFSIVQEVPFYYIALDDDDNGRVENIVSMLGLTQRIVTEKTDITFSDLDYTNPGKILSKLREVSQKFLVNALLNCTKKI